MHSEICRGLLQFENVSYGIEPLEPSVGFEHVIYQVQHKNEGASLYAEDIKPREMPYKIQSIEVGDWATTWLLLFININNVF